MKFGPTEQQSVDTRTSDLPAVVQYGITEPGPATVLLYESWECSVNPAHYSGPVLLG